MIIVIVFVYLFKLKEVFISKKGVRWGVFVRVFWGIDYYIVLWEKLVLFEIFLSECLLDVWMKLMVDIGELLDVVVVEWVGIGWCGKNMLFIMLEYGLWVYLGEMIINILFELDMLVSDLCGSCN